MLRNLAVHAEQQTILMRPGAADADYYRPRYRRTVRERRERRLITAGVRPEPRGDATAGATVVCVSSAPKRTRSERLGRNDPCPCGSGKKYKHCHLGKEVIAVGHHDSTSLRLLELALADRPRFMRESRAPADELSRELVTSFAPRAEGRAAAELLEAYLEKVEARMAEIAWRRSRYFWMHVSRRIPPVPIHDSSAWTTLLYRTVFELALLKHGRPADDGDMKIDEYGSLVPSEITYEDARDVYALEYLAYEYNHAATSFRRVGKGAVLVAMGEDDYSTDAAAELERQMQLLDRRAERYQELFSPYGTAVDAHARALPDSDERFSLLALPVLNAGQREFPAEAAASVRMKPSGTTNYLAAFLTIRPIRDYLTIFAAQIEELVGVAPEKLLAFLWALELREMILIRKDPRAAIQFFQRGYAVTDADGNERMLAELAVLYRVGLKEQVGVELNADAAAADVAQVVQALTYDDDDHAAISLWDKAPFKPIVLDGDYMIWDYAAIPNFLRALAAHVGFLVGEPANHKSAAFEQEVNELIAATEGATPWRVGRLRSDDGRERELDASFVIGDLLYVVECKAFAANPRIDRGDYAALKGRWETLDGYLAQAETLAEFLAENRVGRNYRVPDEVTRIEHCVCTPLAEHVQSSDDACWFDDETPRICVPQELLEYATGTKPWLLERGG